VVRRALHFVQGLLTTFECGRVSFEQVEGVVIYMGSWRKETSRASEPEGRTRRGTNMWYVYIIRCSDASFYTGTTTNLERRLKEHNCGKGGNYTRVRIPVTLSYQESCLNRSSALKHEAQIKRWSKNKKLALINDNKADLSRLSESRD